MWTRQSQNLRVVTAGSAVSENSERIKTMKTRIITALIALCLFLPFLYFSDTLAFLVLIQLLAFVSTYEILRCIGLDKHKALAIPCYIVSILVPYFCRYSEKMYCGRMEIIFLIFFVLAFYMLSAGVFYRGKVDLSSIGTLLTMEMYVVFAVSSILLLRDMRFGQYVYLLVFISAWVTDTGAYFVGKSLGRHKLIPEVSPKKTIEGAVGGFVVGVIGLVIYGAVIGSISYATPQYLYLAIAGGVMSLVSMLGDLIASLLKRHFGIKDFGWILPGHGGVLDRFDSVFATAPFLFFLYYFIPDFALFI